MSIAPTSYFVLYSPPDAESAWEEWKANCGPCAIAAIAQKNLSDIKHLFPDHKKLGGASVNVVLEAFAQLRIRYMWNDSDQWTSFGMAVVLWTRRWFYRWKQEESHWIAICGSHIYDSNVRHWISKSDWESNVAPSLAKTIKGSNGKWKVIGVLHLDPDTIRGAA